MKEARIRIAYLGVKGLPSKSGTERVIEAIITRIVDKFDITVYCDSEYTPRGTIYKGVRLIRIPTIRGKHLRPISLDVFGALHAFFLGRYDVIHMNGVENCFTIPLLKLRYRIVSTSHGIPGRIKTNNKWSKSELFFIRLANYPYLFLSDYPTSISSVDMEYYYSQYRKKVIYIPNGVDLNAQVDREAALHFLKNQGLLPKTFLLFIAGRILELKGCHLLLEAINKMQEDIPVMIIGDMEKAPAYAQKLRELAGNHHVIFIPPISDRGLLFGILDLCSLYVFPSTAEGMSMMLLEAASLGVPMICSDIPENKIVLDEHVTYFRSEDTDDLAEKIHWAMENAEELAQIGETLKKWVKANYSWDSIVSKYELLYRDLYRN